LDFMKPYVGKEGLAWKGFLCTDYLLKKEIAYRLPYIGDFIPLCHLNSGTWIARRELHRKIAESEF